MKTRIIATVVAAAACCMAVVPPAQAGNPAVAYWELSETSGQVMGDASGRRIIGTVGSRVVLGGGTYTFTGPTAPDDRRLAVAPEDDRLDPGIGNYAVNVRIATTVGSPNIVQKGQATSAGGFWKVALNGGYPRCVFRDASGRTLTADLVGTTAANRADDGSWHVIRCELSASGLRVVVDPGTAGEASRFVAGTHGRIDNNRLVSIGGKLDCNGGNVGCDYFTGSMDYVRITRF
jgi:hypothetical protein